jgi:DNA-binding CsgD family transcriptional regulator
MSQARHDMPQYLAPSGQLAAAAVTLRCLLDCDQIYLLENDCGAWRVVIWEGSRRSGETAAELLSAAAGHPLLRGNAASRPDFCRRLSDIGAGDMPGASVGGAVVAAQQLLGRYQLALALPPGASGAIRAWLLSRDDRDFDAEDLRVAVRLRRLVVGVDTSDPTPGDLASGDPRVQSSDDLAVTWSQLSPRERQVVDLLVAGHTAQRMGTVLGISPRTVGKHLQNAYDKLGRHDRLVIAVEHQKLAEARGVA